MLQNPNWDRPLDVFRPETDKSYVNPVSELLLKGADLIEKHGHTKNRLYRDDGSMCFMGALWKAQNTDINRGNILAGVKIWDIEQGIEAAAAVQRVLGLPDTTELASYVPISTMVNWNNAPERTAQEVIDAMRLAARMTAEVKETADAI